MPASEPVHSLLQAAHAAPLCRQPDGLTDSSYHAGPDRWHPAGRLSSTLLLICRHNVCSIPITSHNVRAALIRAWVPNWPPYDDGCAELLPAMSFELFFAAVQASYWQSKETKQVMEEEDALRSAIFAQMLSASL